VDAIVRECAADQSEPPGNWATYQPQRLEQRRRRFYTTKLPGTCARGNLLFAKQNRCDGEAQHDNHH